MGNRTGAETITVGAAPISNYTDNIANQLTSDGVQSFSDAPNGRLIIAGSQSALGPQVQQITNEATAQ